MRLLCATFTAAFLLLATASCATGDIKRPNEAAASVAFEALKRGGYVIVMRHANSPEGQVSSVGLSKGCKLAKGRGLDAEGFFQARAIGAMLKENGVPIFKAYTSPYCRSWDTAALAAGGARVERDDRQVSEKAKNVADMKRDVEADLAAHPGTNIILSSHSNIAPLYGATTRGREKEVPSGVIWIVHPRDWQPIARIDLSIRYPKVTPVVE